MNKKILQIELIAVPDNFDISKNEDKQKIAIEYFNQTNDHKNRIDDYFFHKKEIYYFASNSDDLGKYFCWTYESFQQKLIDCPVNYSKQIEELETQLQEQYKQNHTLDEKIKSMSKNVDKDLFLESLAAINGKKLN